LLDKHARLLARRHPMSAVQSQRVLAAEPSGAVATQAAAAAPVTSIASHVRRRPPLRRPTSRCT
ncbi:MAG TPA: hypothetical protein PKU97_15590, partial [Kofleriaceae bacterium]|nr:hypothetical protein [Kofleriaceae bacterium]